MRYYGEITIASKFDVTTIVLKEEDYQQVVNHLKQHATCCSTTWRINDKVIKLAIHRYRSADNVIKIIGN